MAPAAEETQGAPSPESEEPLESPLEPSEAQEPERVSVRLRAEGEVWVCLVDGRDRPLVEGVTLAAGERAGPFEARRFRVTLGNGELAMSVDGEPVEIPAAAEPLGYEVTPEGVSDLPPAARPDCA